MTNDRSLFFVSYADPGQSRVPGPFCDFIPVVNRCFTARLRPFEKRSEFYSRYTACCENLGQSLKYRVPKRITVNRFFRIASSRE